MPPKRGERGRMLRQEMNEWYRSRDDGMAVRVLMLGESLQSVADDFGIRAGSVGAILKSPWKDYYDLARGNVNLRMLDWEEARHPLRDQGPITDAEVEEAFQPAGQTVGGEGWPPRTWLVALSDL